MPKVILPNKSRSASAPNLFSDVYENDLALKKAIETLLTNADLSGSAGITAANLAKIGSEILGFKVGVIKPSEEVGPKEAYGDLPGATLEITPAVPSVLIALAAFEFAMATETRAFGTLSLDGKDQDNYATFATDAFDLGTARATVFEPFLLDLDAKAHTIKMRVKAQLAPAVGCNPEGTRCLYLLLAK